MGSKGSVAFSHTQSSAQLWAENAGFYQCHSFIPNTEGVTDRNITVGGERHDAEERCNWNSLEMKLSYEALTLNT